MKNYVSFGGGVNSVALHLLLIKEKVDFQSVFVDHETDWPETYQYFAMFQEYLKNNLQKPIVKIKPARKLKGKTYSNLYDFCYDKSFFPNRVKRWCTSDFKVTVTNNYFIKPCFNMLGIAMDENHRAATIASRKGEELRYPLIEKDIDRKECKQIIKKSGLPLPDKSGCYICPFMRRSELKRLRRVHPDLFCKLEQLEQNNNKEREKKGLKPFFSWKIPVRRILNEKQTKLWQTEEYPPCYCGH